jgi:hypothetical protein
MRRKGFIALILVLFAIVVFVGHDVFHNSAQAQTLKASQLKRGVVGSSTGTTILSNTASLDFTAISAQTCEDLTITVTGAVANDAVAIGIPNALYETGATYSGWVSTTDTVKVRRCNISAAPLTNVAAATVRATVIKF